MTTSELVLAITASILEGERSPETIKLKVLQALNNIVDQENKSEAYDILFDWVLKLGELTDPLSEDEAVSILEDLHKVLTFAQEEGL